MADETTEVVPNSLRDFEDRFDALQSEAKTYGIISAVTLMESDPIQGQDTRWSSWHGGLVTCIGMVTCFRERLIRIASSDQVAIEGDED